MMPARIPALMREFCANLISAFAQPCARECAGGMGDLRAHRFAHGLAQPLAITQRPKGGARE